MVSITLCNPVMNVSILLIQSVKVAQPMQNIVVRKKLLLFGLLHVSLTGTTGKTFSSHSHIPLFVN